MKYTRIGPTLVGHIPLCVPDHVSSTTRGSTGTG